MHEINENINKAFTLPSDFYRSPHAFEAVKEKIFGTSWHYINDKFDNRGRFSPAIEKCVHHFHQLVAAFLKE